MASLARHAAPVTLFAATKPATPTARRNRGWIWLSIGLLAWAGCSRPDAYLTGVHSLDAEKYDEAIASFAEAIAENPMHAKACFCLAVALQGKRELPKALTAYGDAIRINQELADAKRLPVAERSEAVKKGVPLGSKLVDVYIGCGAVHADMGNNDEAMDDFGAAIRLDPDRAEAFRRRGAVLLEKGLPDLAIANLTKAIQLKPDDVEALYQRARAFLLTRDWRRAIEDCHSVLRLDAKRMRAYQLLGAANCAAVPPGYAEAIACYREAMRLDQSMAKELQADLAKTYYQLGLSHESAGKKKEAEEAFSQAKTLDPKYVEILKEHQAPVRELGPGGRRITTVRPIPPAPEVAELNLQGTKASLKGDWDQAILHYGEACRLDPDCAESHHGCGVALLEIHSPETALVELNLAIAINKDYAAAYNDRARAYTELKKYRSAVADATEAIRLKPAFVEAFRNRADAYWRDGNFDRAIADCAQVIRLDPALGSKSKSMFAQAHRGRGLEHLKREHWDAALADFDAAVQYDPELGRELCLQTAEAHRGRGLDHTRRGEFKEAIGHLNDAVRLEPWNAKNYEARGRVYFKSAQWKWAIADLKKAMSLDPLTDYEIERLMDKAEEMLKQPEGIRTPGVSPASVQDGSGIY